MLKLLLPNTMQLAPTLPEGVAAVEYDVAADIPAADHDAQALVVWGNPPELLARAAAALPELRWVQSLAAGPEHALAAGFGERVLITSGRGLHDQPVAEHTLALLLAAARRLDLATRAQVGHRWADEIGGLQPSGNSQRFATLSGAHVVIWGFGSIATHLTPLLRGLGARVSGIARTAGPRAGVAVHDASAIPRLLPTADALVLILPITAQTRGLVDAEVLSQLPPRAWLVNVGRGAVLDEAALLAALRASRLAGAALDVTSVEPLPADSQLWDAPNLIITPHAAGGRPVGADELISANLAALLAGGPLRNLVAGAPS